MRILLLNPNRDTKENISIDPVLTRCVGIPAKAPYLWPPIGLASLAGYLIQDFDVEILDAQAEKLSTEKTLNRVDHDIVFINAGTPTIEQDLSIANVIKPLGAKTVMIGTHATYFHRELIKDPGVDFIVRGEPERPGLKLAKAVASGRPLSGVPNLTWKGPAGAAINRNEGPIRNLDEMPFAARDLLPNGRYYDILTRKSPITFSITSRGCPFSCRFCSAGVYGGRTFRARSAGNVIAEMEEIRSQGFRDVTFFDDTFTVDRKRVIDICEGIGGTGISWRCLSRADTLDREVLEAMRESGCYQIQFGVESGDPGMLIKMNKGISLEQTRRAFQWCDELSIETVGFFMLGYPGETQETVERTISFANELSPDFVTFNMFTPIPGSEDFESLKPRAPWGSYNFTTTSFCGIPSDEISSMVAEAYRGYYLRPSYLMRRVSKTGEPLRIARQNLRFWTKRSGVLWRFMSRGR
jgi:anaerobic magnesium-protoporphyrin IX monomethyl ester cyclase